MPDTYRESGVDIELESKAISSLIRSLEGSSSVVAMSHHFTGLIEFGDHALSLCTDGVGTKVILARELGKLDTIGIDCIAMNVNDMICAGARPLAFVDYLAMDKPTPEQTSEIGKGLAEGARLSGIEILGGETATLPEIVNGFDLAGTCLGYVKKDSIITGERIREGDAIIGLASSGFHSNGYTLIRKVLGNRFDEAFGDSTIGLELLKPTEIYVSAVMELISSVNVHGLINVTGGGFRNLTRLRTDVMYTIDSPLPIPPIFDLLQDAGSIETREMFSTFNMGMGFAVILPADEASKALAILNEHHSSKVVGYTGPGEGVNLLDSGSTLPRY